MRQLTNNERTIWTIVFIVEGVVTIICNILSIFVFARKTRLSKPCILLMNQCVADLCVGIVSVYLSDKYIGISFEKERDKVKTTEDVCVGFDYIVNAILWNFFVDLSLSSLALIALDRAFAVFKPFRHRLLQTKHYLYGIVCTWILSTLPTSVFLSLKCEENTELQVLVSFTTGAVVILATTMVVSCSYACVYIKLKFFPVFQNHNTSHARSQTKLSSTLFFASLASLSTVLPACAITASSVMLPSTRSPNNVNQFAVFLMLANSSINFVIYAWKFPVFS